MEEKERGAAKRVTTRDIAQAAGVHFTTVAEALRGSPRVKEETRKRIEGIARKMGYFPDPVLGALNAYRINRREAAFQGTLAWLNGYPEKNYFSDSQHFYHSETYEGASGRSEFFGYKLEPLWLGEPGMTNRRAVKILESRCTVGIVVGPQPEGFQNIEFPWERFSAVSIGYSAHGVNLPSVGPNQFANAQRVYQKAVDAGFTRIGFACPLWLDDRVANGYSGGFLAARQRHGGDRPHLPLFMDTSPEGDSKDFLEWVQTNQPEVILISPKMIYRDYLVEAKLRIPADISVIWMAAPKLSETMSGIYEDGLTVGKTAIDILVGMIRRYSKGNMHHERNTLISGKWVDGKTCKHLANLK
jgi:DNA-binding LacI/PurR family transcriptional regulator